MCFVVVCVCVLIRGLNNFHGCVFFSVFNVFYGGSRFNGFHGFNGWVEIARRGLRPQSEACSAGGGGG